MRSLAIALIVCTGGSSFAQTGSKLDMLLTKSEAIALLAPKQLADGAVQSVLWSPDGKYLAVLTVDSKESRNLPSLLSATRGMPTVMPDCIVSVYDTKKQETVTIWKTPIDRSQIRQIGWLPDSPYLVAIVDSPVINRETKQFVALHTSVALITTTGKSSTLIPHAPNRQITGLHEGPNSFGIIVTSSEGTADSVIRRLSLVGRDGRIRGSIINPPPILELDWDKQNQRVYAVNHTPVQGGVKSHFALLDFANGATMPVDEPRIARPKPAVAEFDLVRGGTQSREAQSSVELTAAWLVAKEKGPKSAALVAADAESMSLSPIGNAVYFVTKGTAMIRPLARLPKELAMQALEAAERTKLMSDCKQVALALLIYSADYDDLLPSNSGDWMSALSPYTKNNSVMDGFIYTYSGGNLADLKSPAETELGYKLGPGGRAVAYADGHVRWIPDK